MRRTESKAAQQARRSSACGRGLERRRSERRCESKERRGGEQASEVVKAGESLGKVRVRPSQQQEAKHGPLMVEDDSSFVLSGMEAGAVPAERMSVLASLPPLPQLLGFDAKIQTHEQQLGAVPGPVKQQQLHHHQQPPPLPPPPPQQPERLPAVALHTLLDAHRHVLSAPVLSSLSQADPPPRSTASPPMTPACSPPDDQLLEPAPSKPATESTAASDGAWSCRPRRNSGCWQLIDDGDRIDCVMVSGSGANSPRAPGWYGTNGKEAFGLEVEEQWHGQLESLVEMGYGVKAAAEALRACDGHLKQAFKFLERRRYDSSI